MGLDGRIDRIYFETPKVGKMPYIVPGRKSREGPEHSAWACVGRFAFDYRPWLCTRIHQAPKQRYRG